MPCNSYQGPYSSESEEEAVARQTKEELQKRFVDRYNSLLMVANEATRAACTLSKFYKMESLKHGFLCRIPEGVSAEDMVQLNVWLAEHETLDKLKVKG